MAAVGVREQADWTVSLCRRDGAREVLPAARAAGLLRRESVPGRSA